MTNGIVTVLIDGTVVMKIVTGSEGRKVEEVAEIIRKRGEVPTLDKAYEIATNVFGDIKESLVVLGKEKEKYKGQKELPELYRSTFHQPAFNPRLKDGNYEHLAVVNFFTY